jgi:hypothetical protein
MGNGDGAEMPDQHQPIDGGGKQQRHITAVNDLQRVRREKSGVDDDKETGGDRADQ